MRRAAVLLLAACMAPETERTFELGAMEVRVNVSRAEPQSAIYLDAARCAGLAGDPAEVEWYALEQPITFPDGSVWYGAYQPAGRRIYYTDSLSIRHESLHDLLWIDRRETGHPSPPFGVCS